MIIDNPKAEQKGSIQSDAPYISAAQSLPEITFRGVILSIILVVILTASNAFLGLKVGITVAASIPAAVISMGILRFFRNSNILENNIVQTAASAGEALVAGIIFVLPALVLLGYWQGFNYWQIVFIAITGGVLGVLFSVPLRRVLLAHKSLKFPEGTAIGHVLMTGSQGKSGNLSEMIAGGVVGGLVSLAQSGFKVLSEGMRVWFSTGTHTIFGLGLGFNPALLAAGYIVGVQVAIATLVGMVICWLVAMPILTSYATGDAIVTGKFAVKIWKEQIRYIGIGVMLVSGFWTLLTLFKPIMASLKASFISMRQVQTSGALIPRTERDLPINLIIAGLVIMLVPVFCLIAHYADITKLNVSDTYYWLIIAIMTVYALIAGFVFSSLCGYFSGLVGTTNSPISAMTLGSLILGSLLLLVLLGVSSAFNLTADQNASAAVMIIATSAIIACAATISNDNIQDLKAGHMVGATPWKQQVMLVLGVVVAALVAPLVLRLLFEAYGMGEVFPHADMDPNQALSAPQATAISFVVKAVFAHTLPWGMLGTGAVLAISCLLFNSYLQKYNLGLPTLALGIGIYLPLEATAPLVIGGLASHVIHSLVKRVYPTEPLSSDNANDLHQAKQRGLILACGMVAGSTIMGVILAIPFAISKSTEVLSIVPASFESIADNLSIAVTIAIVAWFYYVVCRKRVAK